MITSFIASTLASTALVIGTGFAGPGINTVSSVVAEANGYDYTQTVSGIDEERLALSEIQDIMKPYGHFGSTEGMPLVEYLDAMNFKWIDVTPYQELAYASTRDSAVQLAAKRIVVSTPKAPEHVTVKLSKRYTYDDLVDIMEQLAKYDGVYMYMIGYSTDGAPMYALDVNLAREDSPIVLLTGQVHARESAGATYILKELADILSDYYAGDESAIEVLSTTRFAAVPCVNPDGHDGIGFDTKNWTYSDGQLWKATSNGTDLNRNFPGLSWMQTKKGFKETIYKSTSPNKLYYWGDYAGSCNETKAMMKFYQYFIGVKHAEILIDYHQQGRISFAGKDYAPAYNNKLAEDLRKSLYAVQKSSPAGRSYAYDYGDTQPDYGLCGTGSTNTDYAWAVAMGTQFSAKYGFSVHVDTNGNEYPLIMLPEYDKAEVELLPMRSPEFRSFSWEIGSGREYLGYSDSTLKLIEKEYTNYGFDRMLYAYSEVANR